MVRNLSVRTIPSTLLRILRIALSGRGRNHVFPRFVGSDDIPDLCELLCARKRAPTEFYNLNHMISCSAILCYNPGFQSYVLPCKHGKNAPSPYTMLCILRLAVQNATYYTANPSIRQENIRSCASREVFCIMENSEEFPIIQKQTVYRILSVLLSFHIGHIGRYAPRSAIQRQDSVRRRTQRPRRSDAPGI